MATVSAQSIHERIGLINFELSLDQQQPVYYCDEVISGKLFLHLDSPIIATCVKLIWRGEAQVSFSNRSATFHRKFSAQDVYLDEENYLIGDQSSSVEIGSGEFPFTLNLPESIPCSFEGRYGRVRYSVKAILVISQDSEITTDVLPFTVAPIFDLNSHALAPLPISESHTKTFMGHTEPISMSVYLPVRGYVPGQIMPLKINLKNESTIDVKKLRIVLKKVILYHSLDNVRKHKEIVVEINQPVERTCELYQAEIDVPAVPPSGIICNCIVVGYTLKVETCVDVNEWYYRLFHKNLKIRMNIIVGTVPLKNYEIPIQSTNEALKFNSPSPELFQYQMSRIYRSSKPDQDDSEEKHSTAVDDFSPLYRVYTFKNSKKLSRT